MSTDKSDNVKLVIRLDKSLHRSLASEAKRSLRSLNGEMLWRLRCSLDQQQETATT